MARVTYSPTNTKKPWLVQYRTHLWRFATKAQADDFAAKFN